MLQLAKQLSNLSADNITGEVIPTDHYWHDSPVGDVGIVRPAQVRAFVRGLFTPATHAHRRQLPTGAGRHPRRPAPRTAVDSGCIT